MCQSELTALTNFLLLLKEHLKLHDKGLKLNDI